MSSNKLPSLVHEEIAPAKRPFSGRPRKITLVDKHGLRKKVSAKPLAPILTTQDLYLDVVNLKKKEISEFLSERYPFFSKYDGAARVAKKATSQDIEKFQKIVRRFAEGAKKKSEAKKQAIKYHGGKYMPPRLPFIGDDIEFNNEQLLGCRPKAIQSAYMDKEPSQREKEKFKENLKSVKERFGRQRHALAGVKFGNSGELATDTHRRLGKEEQETAATIIDEYIMPRDRQSGRSGGYFWQIVMVAESSMSACCYYLMQAIEKGEDVKMCDCGRVFIAEHRGQKHCKEINCLKERKNRNRRRSYAKSKTRQAE